MDVQKLRQLKIITIMDAMTHLNVVNYLSDLKLNANVVIKARPNDASNEVVTTLQQVELNLQNQGKFINLYGEFI